MRKQEKNSPSGIITIAFLLTLVGVNAVWLIVSRYGGTLMALVFYVVVSFLCIKCRHFRAGVIAGIFGFGIHFYELFVRNTTELIGIDPMFFYANLILPIPLTFTSYLASRMEPPEYE
jgi:fatty acid desaturase